MKKYNRNGKKKKPHPMVSRPWRDIIAKPTLEVQTIKRCLKAWFWKFLRCKKYNARQL